MCSRLNDKYNPPYSKTYLSIETPLCTWILCISWFSFFAFWGAEKHVSHFAPFRPTRYVLKSFRWLEFSNRVRNWNIIKKNHLRVVEISIMPIGYTNIHIQINVSESFIKEVSFVFCELKIVASWNESKTIILVRLSIEIPKRNSNFIFKVNVCQCKLAFSKY